MVPLRLDVYDACPPPSSSLPNTRPTLVLQDLTAERPRKTRTRHSPWSRVENVLIAASMAAVLLFFVFSFVFSLLHSVQQSYADPVLPSVVTISKTVVRGDTLARFALRYGNPNTYILEREDQISRANHLSGTMPLVPGQRLQIPVTNPTVIAQIEQVSPHTRLASR